LVTKNAWVLKKEDSKLHEAKELDAREGHDFLLKCQAYGAVSKLLSPDLICRMDPSARSRVLMPREAETLHACAHKSE